MIPLRDDNPTRTRPIVTYAILGLCVLVFLWQLALGPGASEAAVYALGFIPAAARLADPGRDMPLQIYMPESGLSLAGCTE